jgi:hypothetical protein
MATATAEARETCRPSLMTATNTKRRHRVMVRAGSRASFHAPTVLVIITVAGVPVLMSIREAFFQTNTGVNP